MNRLDLQSLNEPSKKVRTRRILSLEERVRVIREYERKPVYQQMAYMFNCSSDQIKSIIANKESIMQYYNNIVNGSQNEAHVIRQRKIAFLGKLVYEYIRRARCYVHVPIDAEPIRLKALAFKKAIKIENFFPNNTWMQNFKTAYNISFPMKHYSQASLRHPLPSLHLSSIISFVSRREDKDHTELDIGGNDSYDSQSHAEYDDCERGIGEALTPSLKYDEQHEGRDSEYDCYGYGGDNSYPEVVQLESDEEDKPPPAKTLRSDAGMSTATAKQLPAIPVSFRTIPAPASVQIASYAEALRHLQPLEDFVLHQENYRAIGLISQLEVIFKNPPKPVD